MINETSGFSYQGLNVGWRYTRPSDHGLPNDAFTGSAVAVVMDGVVVATFATYDPIWEAMRDGQIVDATAQHDVPEGHAVIDLVVDGQTQMTLHISNELLGAAITSNPTLVKMTYLNLGCRPGWRYTDGVLHV